MKVDFYTTGGDGSRKVLTLEVRGGAAVSTFGDKSIADYVLRGRYGENPGQLPGFTAEDGADFLRVLPRNFSGHRFFARLVESDSANVYRYRPAAESSKVTWTPFTGPRGGKGFVNSATGEVIYQAEMPGSGGGETQGDAPATNRLESPPVSQVAPQPESNAPKAPITRLRRDMPQIAGVDKPDFFAVLRNEGHTVTDRDIPVSQVKVMQSDHNPDKVASMVAKLKAGQPIGTSRSIISSDGYVMDGNHRLLAQQAVDKSSELPVSQVDMTAAELVTRMEGYGRSFKVDAKEGPEARAVSLGERREKMAAEMQEIGRQYPTANKAGGDTYSRFRNADGSWTKERSALHGAIVSKAVSGAAPSAKKTVFLMGGGSASGKGTLLKNGLIQRSESFAHIDADEIKNDLPEFKSMSAGYHMGAAAFAHEESSHLSNRIMDEAFAKGADVSLDGTGDSGIEKLAGKIKKMKDAGYRVSANYVTVDTETAVARSQERGRKSGRFVPVAAIENIHQQVSAVVPKAIAMGLYDDFKLWDNNTDTPRLVAEAQGTNLKVLDQELWDRFLKKAE